MEVDPHRVIFLGKGVSALCYYRAMLPAMAMGADWVGVSGDPPKPHFATGMVWNKQTQQFDTKVPDILNDYDIVVIQQPAGTGWEKLIDALRERGVKVVFEIDDYLHGIESEDDHMFKDYFDRTLMKQIERAMRRCDALIASTEYIAEQYSAFQPQTFVCRNGIDLRRYDLKKPKRKGKVNIGWAGATGHLGAVQSWFAQAAHIMRMRDNVNFVCIGRMDFARGFTTHFPEERVIGVPWAAIEQYPGAMTMMDIALAPAAETRWWRGKSDLRWLEASALGIPTIASPLNYPEIEPGETGFHAASDMEASEHMLRLVDDPVERRVVGKKAKDYVREHRGMNTMVRQWEEAFAVLRET